MGLYHILNKTYIYIHIYITYMLLKQDCNKGGKERSLATYCEEHIPNHEDRGQGQGTKHVQRCKFYFTALFLWGFI